MKLRFLCNGINPKYIAQANESMVTDHISEKTRINIIKSIIAYRKLHTKATFAKYALIPDEFIDSNINVDVYRELEVYENTDTIYFLFQWWIAKLVITLTNNQLHDCMSRIIGDDTGYTPEITIERMPAWAFSLNTGVIIQHEGKTLFSVLFCNVNFWYRNGTDTRGMTVTATDTVLKKELVFVFTFIKGTNTLNLTKFNDMIGNKMSDPVKAGMYVLLESIQFACREPETKVIDIVKNPKTAKYSIDVATRSKISTVKGKPTSPINRPHSINVVKDIPVEITDEPKIKREDSFYVPPHCQKYYIGKRKRDDGSIIPLSERTFIIKKKAGYVAGGDEDGISKNTNTKSVLN